MPRLVLLNGAPGLGKTTLARRYAADHPMGLVLDVDAVRALLGRWEDDPAAAGLAARDLAVAMARTHLASGHDVVVAQLVARAGFTEALEEVGAAAGADVTEVVLTTDRADALARAARHPAHLVTPEEAAELHDRLVDHLATRPDAVLLATVDGEEDATYRALLDALERDPRSTHHSPTNGSTSGT